MVQGVNREYIFEEENEKLKYLYLVKEYAKKYDIKILAYCIMDNHTHFLIHAVNSTNLSMFMKEINSRYAMYYNRKKQRVGYVFRNRFESKAMLTELQVLRCIKYIHMNPVKAKIVEKEEEYKFSSYNDYFQKSKFINSKNLNSIFNNKENYPQKISEIEYKELNLEQEPINLKVIMEDYLKEKNLKFEELYKCKNEIKKFMKYLNLNEYKYSKTEIAEVLRNK